MSDYVTRDAQNSSGLGGQIGSLLLGSLSGPLGSLGWGLTEKLFGTGMKTSQAMQDASQRALRDSMDEFINRGEGITRSGMWSKSGLTGQSVADAHKTALDSHQHSAQAIADANRLRQTADEMRSIGATQADAAKNQNMRDMGNLRRQLMQAPMSSSQRAGIASQLSGIDANAKMYGQMADATQRSMAAGGELIDRAGQGLARDSALRYEQYVRPHEANVQDRTGAIAGFASGASQGSQEGYARGLSNMFAPAANMLGMWGGKNLSDSLWERPNKTSQQNTQGRAGNSNDEDSFG